jgi:predicted TIM-barrel fold metal-dependent hydrolase
MKYYDCHCHIFTQKETLNLRLLFEIIFGFPKEREKSLHLQKSLAAKENIFERITEKIQQLKRIRNFLKTGFSDSEEDIFNIMESEYNNNFNIAPLMFDLECIFMADRQSSNEFSLHKDAIISEYEQVVSEFQNSNHSFIKEAEAVISGIRLKDSLKDNRQGLEELKEINEELNTHFGSIKEDKLSDEKMLLSLKSNFDIQLEDISALQQKYPEKVYPFIAIDPRREGIIDKFINEIYDENIFCGVKLYTPNGYSPTDIDLMKPDGLYAFCVEQDIPITAHNSFMGFATPLSSVSIYGDIYENGVKPANNPVKLSKVFSKDWVLDRATKFNHPDIWEKVLETYPKLKLNLAHFGNGNAEWQEKVYSMIGNPKYPNLHTDLSCWCYVKAHKKEIGLQSFYDKYYKNASDYVKSKILYGSDFYLDLMKIDSLSDFLENFNIFPDIEFKRIAYTNAKKFLNI